MNPFQLLSARLWNVWGLDVHGLPLAIVADFHRDVPIMGVMAACARLEEKIVETPRHKTKPLPLEQCWEDVA